VAPGQAVSLAGSGGRSGARLTYALRVRVDRSLERARSVYLAAQARVLDNRGAFLLLSGAALYFAMGLSRHIPVDLFPSDFSHIMASVEVPTDFGIEKTESIVRGMEAALEPIRRLGVDAIFRHVTRYLDALEAPLVERGFVSLRLNKPAARSGILSLKLPPSVDGPELVQRLRAQGVSCSLPDGCLRFSPHWPNAIEEVPRVVHAVEQALVP